MCTNHNHPKAQWSGHSLRDSRALVKAFFLIRQSRDSNQGLFTS